MALLVIATSIHYKKKNVFLRSSLIIFAALNARDCRKKKGLYKMTCNKSLLINYDCVTGIDLEIYDFDSHICPIVILVSSN